MSVLEQVIEMLTNRAKLGLAKYGHPVTPGDGHDWRDEALMELGDAVQYVTAQNMEEKARNATLEAENKRLLGLACLLCGKDESCELDKDTGEANWPGSPCTFDPSPVDAAKRFMAERDDWQKQYLLVVETEEEIAGDLADALWLGELMYGVIATDSLGLDARLAWRNRFPKEVANANQAGG